MMLETSLIDIGLYILTGAGAGLAAGMLGVGGGLIIVPVLFFIFTTQGYPPQHLMHMALATSLATIVVTSVSSTRAHHKRHAVLWPIVLLLTPGIVFGAWLGGLFAASLDSIILNRFFATFELAVAINLLLKTQPKQHATSMRKTVAVIGGVVIGFISTIAGIGGGTLTVPFLHWFNISMQRAVATSAACGFPIALAGTLSYLFVSYDLELDYPYSFGYLHLDAFLLIASSSYLVAPLGAHIAHSLSEKKLRLLFACILIILSVSMYLS